MLLKNLYLCRRCFVLTINFIDICRVSQLLDGGKDAPYQ